ncbi:MAG: hypothetical protein KAS72_11755 [Phycisphaerales bacterium]|nr:hypothetical protein [Phycisphaerales bacterium]
MSQRIAVAIVHGVGKQDADFSAGITRELTHRFSALLPKRITSPEEELAIEPVHWAPVLQRDERELWKRMKRGGNLDFTALRRFMIDFAADAIAYQPTPNDDLVYGQIHAVFAHALDRLAEKAGPAAPLCVIAHSLGTVIASNYFYDLQTDASRGAIPDVVRQAMGDTPIEQGETFSLLYTLGSPLSIWSLRYEDFGRPIDVPSPKLAQHYGNLDRATEWVNFYDRDDVIGYPLKSLNAAYRKAVKRDREINAGNILTSWNPASHLGYWTDNDVTVPIARSLAKLWKAVNRGN